MSTDRIPDDIRRQADEIVRQFNETVLNDPERGYATRYRGRFLYLDRSDYGRPMPVCRLTYTGSMDDWTFAIFKYSNERYDPAEFVFPGSGHVDGTIEGAMRAGLEAYPFSPQRQMGGSLLGTLLDFTRRMA